MFKQILPMAVVDCQIEAVSAIFSARKLAGISSEEKQVHTVGIAILTRQ